MDYDRYGAGIRAEYELFANALMADYLTHSAARRGIAGVSQLRTSGKDHAARFAARATELTFDYLRSVEYGAAVDPTAYLHLLRQVAQHNINALVARLMHGALRPADLLTTQSTGAIGQLLQQRLERPRLVARDKAGRAWLADKLVLNMARNFAYQTYLDAVLDGAGLDGVTQLQIVYPDPHHEHHGTVLSPEEVAALRDTIFHPNSHARLVPHVPT